MRVIWVGIALFLTTVSASVAAFGPITFSSDADYNNNNPPTSGLFRDIGPLVRQQGINRGFDLGPTGHTALNFVGTVGAGGSNSVTLYDTNPTTATPDNIFSGNLSLSADILFKEFNNTKQGGFVFLYNEGFPTNSGLALMLSDAGNTDNNILSIADMNGPAMTTLQSTSLSGGLGEVAWYRLTMDMTVSGGTFIINGKVFSHTTGTDPGSALGSQIGPTLAYTNTFAALGIQSSGEIGLAMREILQAAPNTNMVSIANFSGVPEPASTSLVVMGLALCSVAGLGMLVRRRKSA
ncbi:MAG TPA: PEP-CTERM sorting domain-containing protein [Verrucomicrobiae bacterium]|nr:PEP-CTERM sorting domain-containing protein [Verrucomicrobiae bacterium]